MSIRDFWHSAIFILIVALGLLQLALMMVWARRLHRLHADEYSFFQVLRMMFRPQSADSMTSEMWRDYEPIQRRNRILGFIIVFGGTAVAFAIILLNRAFQQSWRTL
jgi:hypothetical protein